MNPTKSKRTCPDCLGNGVAANAGGEVPADNCCPTCNGSGKRGDMDGDCTCHRRECPWCEEERC